MTSPADTGGMKRVPLTSIDGDDRYFKISRNIIRDELRSSIREFGVLDPPVVTPRGRSYRAVFGFNRLDVLRELGAEAADCLVAPDFGAGFFARGALLKCQRNEAGPIGRLRALAILRDLGVDDAHLELIASKGLHVSADFVRDGALLAAALDMPAVLRDYCDVRDIHLRIVRDLARMHPSDRALLSSWVEFAPLRVNIFRFIVEMLADIRDRDGGLDAVAGISPGEDRDRKTWEEELYGRVRAARYPEFSSLSQEADGIVSYFASRGLELTYPPYFEGDRVELTLRLGRRDDPESVGGLLSGVDWSRLRPLLDLL
ncbi:MAG TPA: hypothetical protein PLA65_04020 [Spirochaetota bacterium]|nr:ParB N-terminal domain-containing protein [Spirochaetota bacterium]HOD16772.1 hypothetical protein [Spirochaetota bacterium]HPG49429.1 hypothetical protein [Spirochaetota bacterium]HPN11201.1 hypothetical protein [Spirochaetota bacterium]